MPSAVEPAAEPVPAIRALPEVSPELILAEMPSTKNSFACGSCPLTLKSPCALEPCPAACGLCVTMPGVIEIRSWKLLPFKGTLATNFLSTTVLTDASVVLSVRPLASTMTDSATEPTFRLMSRVLVSPTFRSRPVSCVVAKPARSMRKEYAPGITPASRKLPSPLVVESFSDPVWTLISFSLASGMLDLDESCTTPRTVAVVICVRPGKVRLRISDTSSLIF